MTTARRWLESEPFTLVLSAGFFGFYGHTGLLLALEEAGLRPRRVVGVSAGALAGGLWACGVPAQSLAERLDALTREQFWDPGIVPVAGLLKGRKFARVLDELLAPVGVRTLEQAPIPAATVVWDLLRRRVTTVERGSVEAAIRGSCAVPGMFRPVRVGGRWVLDGGVADRAGVSAIAPGERALISVLPHTTPWPEVASFGQWDGALADGPTRRMFVPLDLPRVNPFALDRGAAARASTYAQFSTWLDA